MADDRISTERAALVFARLALDIEPGAPLPEGDSQFDDDFDARFFAFKTGAEWARGRLPQFGPTD